MSFIKYISIISDEDLFKQPSPCEDCPICEIPLPTLESGRTWFFCCGKTICSGCWLADVYDRYGNIIPEKKCPFCRTPHPTSDEALLEEVKKLEALNDPEGTYNLGCYYRFGKYCLAQDYDRAFELYVRAAALGYAKANNNIGHVYLYGEGVERDEEKARHYFELAAIGGGVRARFYLADQEAKAGNIGIALKHHMIAAGCGHDLSLKEIQKMYKDRKATKDDYTKALRAYQAYLTKIKSKQRDAVAALGDRCRYY